MQGGAIRGLVLKGVQRRVCLIHHYERLQVMQRNLDVEEGFVRHLHLEVTILETVEWNRPLVIALRQTETQIITLTVSIEHKFYKKKTEAIIIPYDNKHTSSAEKCKGMRVCGGISIGLNLIDGFGLQCCL
jgi:hypothetical protein